MRISRSPHYYFCGHTAEEPNSRYHTTMDLLGDLGTQDQLTAARAEIRVLQEKVKELAGRVKVLTVENESLKAEVEIYRQEAALPSFSKLALGQDASAGDNSMIEEDEDLFVRAGQGVYANNNEMTWKNMHGTSNPLSVALSLDETIVASGGADKTLRLIFSSSSDVGTAATVELSAPVISVAFATSSSTPQLLACGCMDGSAYLIQYAVANVAGRSVMKIVQHSALPSKHVKYVKTVAWADGVLATASADGNVHLYGITMAGLDPLTLEHNHFTVTLVESLHLETAIEALAFTADQHLLCYARSTPYIASFDLQDNMKQTKINLNKASAGATSGGFDEHVSMAVMDLKVGATHHQHNCWLAATDTARNFILDPRSHRIVRNLYGHANDGYSQPKVAWGSGSYVFGNTQDEAVVCVWDVGK